MPEIQTHPHTHGCTRTRMNMHAHTRMHTHAHVYTHASTRKHAYTQIPVPTVVKPFYPFRSLKQTHRVERWTPQCKGSKGSQPAVRSSISVLPRRPQLQHTANRHRETACNSTQPDATNAPSPQYWLLPEGNPNDWQQRCVDQWGEVFVLDLASMTPAAVGSAGTCRCCSCLDGSRFLCAHCCETEAGTEGRTEGCDVVPGQVNSGRNCG